MSSHKQRKNHQPTARGGKRPDAPARETARPAREKQERVATAVAERPVREDRRAQRPSGAAIEAWREESAPAEEARSSGIERMRRAPARGKTADNDLSPVLRWYQAMRRRMRHTRRRWHHIVREKHAHNFPESERLPIQMVLFAWSMLPMAGSLLREHLLGRRKRRTGQQSRFWTRFSRKNLHPAAFLGGACALAAVIILCSIFTVGTTVSYDGEVIAAVASESAARSAQSRLEKMTARTLGKSYTIDDTLLQYSSGLLRRKDVVDDETFEDDLSREIGLVTPAHCLYINGEFVGATTYGGALEELLKQLKSAATSENTISCEFAEDVEIKEEYVSTDQVMNLGYLAETLYSTKTAEVTYEVKKGDTWSEIAEAHDLSSKELLALNPGYDINKLQIGEVLTLSASVPYLTMTVKEREHYIDDVMYDIEYTDSPNLYKGDYKVTSAGQFGAADVVANVTYVNGEETERTVLSSVTLQEPVTEQRLRGTKDRPTWLPTGTFRWPVSGRVTSSFGGRRSPGGIGSTNHKGIDIAAPRGTPVYAADGGTVTYSGWMSGYGYMVQINHGNGYVTYYGHNSKLTVSVGQKVYKGQQIAKVGSTGNSTGNHCHFEIRYHGVPKNPRNYL